MSKIPSIPDVTPEIPQEIYRLLEPMKRTFDVRNGQFDETLQWVDIQKLLDLNVLKTNVSGSIARATPNAAYVLSEVVTTSGTSFNVDGLPIWTASLLILIAGVSMNGATDDILIQLGDTGGIETTGYTSTSSRLGTGVATVSSTSGFIINNGAAAESFHGFVRLVLQDPPNHTWVASGTLGHGGGTFTTTVGGSKSLSSALTQVTITRSGTTDSFDAGAFSVRVEP